MGSSNNGTQGAQHTRTQCSSREQQHSRRGHQQERRQSHPRYLAAVAAPVAHLVRLRRAASASIAREEKEITTRTIVHALQLQRAGDLAAGLAAEAFDLESAAPANRREGADRELLLFGDTLDEVVDVVFGKLPEWIADLIQCNNWCPDGSCPCDGAGKLLQCVLYLLVPGGDN